MNQKRKGLGRGLDALLGGDEAPRDALATLPVARIRPGRYQPRTRMDQEALAELAASIQSQGLMQPVLVRPVDRDRYELIAGERRWRAAQMAGMQEIPALVREVPDESALAMSLIENIQRENLNPMEEAAGLQRLADEFRMTHEQVADAVGRSRSATTNLLRLLRLAKPVQELVMEGAVAADDERAVREPADRLHARRQLQRPCERAIRREDRDAVREQAVVDADAVTPRREDPPQHRELARALPFPAHRAHVPARAVVDAHVVRAARAHDDAPVRQPQRVAHTREHVRVAAVLHADRDGGRGAGHEGGWGLGGDGERGERQKGDSDAVNSRRDGGKSRDHERPCYGSMRRRVLHGFSHGAPRALKLIDRARHRSRTGPARTASAQVDRLARRGRIDRC
jgi:ParB family chromosome partitioning protein